MIEEEIKKVSMERRQEFADDRNNVQQLPLIAKEIKLRAISIKRNMFEIGKLLTQAKKLTDHGKFKKWVRKNCDFSYPTANNLMKVYACCLKKPQLVTTIQTSILYQVASKKFPQDLRKYLFKHGDYLEKISNKQIKNILKQYKAGEINLKSPEIKGLLKYNKNKKKYANYQKRIEQNIKLLEKLKNTVAGIAEKIGWPIASNEKLTELTSEQKKMIEDSIKDIVKVIEEARPEYKVNENMKPELEVA